MCRREGDFKGGKGGFSWEFVVLRITGILCLNGPSFSVKCLTGVCKGAWRGRSCNEAHAYLVVYTSSDSCLSFLSAEIRHLPPSSALC